MGRRLLAELLPAGAYPEPLERHATAGGDHHAHRHFVLGQRAGLVGGNDGCGAERLHGGQMPHDGVAPRHPLDAD